VKFRQFASVIACFALISHVFALLPNTNTANAVSYEVGQGWVSHYIEQTTPERWLRFTTVGGRGYCAEAAQGSDTHIAFNPNLTVYRDVGGGNAWGTNDTGAFNPAMTLGARFCFVDTGILDTRAERRLKLSVPVVAGSGDAGFVRMRVYETTMTGAYSWGVDATDTWYGGYIHVMNNSASAVTVSFTAICRCVPLLSGACGTLTPGATVVQATESIAIAPRSTTNYSPSRCPTWNTEGNSWVVVGIPAPLTDFRAYAITGTASASIAPQARTAGGVNPQVEVVRQVLPLQ
jgi:hypothetical protein